MQTQNAARAALDGTMRDPQVIDRLLGAIDSSSIIFLKLRASGAAQTALLWPCLSRTVTCCQELPEYFPSRDPRVAGDPTAHEAVINTSGALEHGIPLKTLHNAFTNAGRVSAWGSGSDPMGEDLDTEAAR
jgi:hypothetical protein